MLRHEGLEGLVDPKMVEREIADATDLSLSDLDRAASEILKSKSSCSSHLGSAANTVVAATPYKHQPGSVSQPGSSSERRRVTHWRQLYGRSVKSSSPLGSNEADDDDKLSIGSDDVIYLTTI